MKKSYILTLFAAALLATGCSKEHPFGDGFDGQSGQFLKSALSVGINEDALNLTTTRAAADVNVDDFDVIFSREGDAQPYLKCTYGEMPEVITLPAGKYTVTASYGKNLNAEWESPYFLGNTDQFEVRPYEITSHVDPIVCNLENIKVTIDFDPVLRSRMSAQSYVDVKVGHSSALRYTLTEADAAKAGFFMHSDERTLVAEFHGNIDGVDIVESKSMIDIEKGTHYKITFKLHSDGAVDGTGDADANVTVDAVVNKVNINRDVTVGEDEVLDDSERPREDDGGKVDPEPGPGPDVPEPPVSNGPSITATDGVNLDGVNDGNSLSELVLHIHSNTGIDELSCVIDSEGLTEDDLEDLDLSKNLNLAQTPDSMVESLTDLGFPTNVKGWKDVDLKLTDFLELLGALGNYQHNFIITVKDSEGSKTITLSIKY